MKKGFTVIIISIMLICLFAVCFTACNGGKYKMTDFVINFDEFAKTYEVGDEINLNTIKMYAKFSDDSQEAIPLEKVSIKVDGVAISLNEIGKITETAGTKVIEIKYSEYVKNVTIRVNEHHIAVLTGLRMEYTDVAKVYTVRDTNVSMAGLKVWAIYDGQDEVSIALTDPDLRIMLDQIDVTTDLTQITATTGNKVIYVRYKTIVTTDFFNITVNDALSSVVINVPTNYKTAYNVGDAVSVAGITASATYRSDRVVNDIEIKYYLGDNLVDFTALTATKGTKVVTAKAVYEGTTATQNITYTVANFVTGISLNTTGALLEYVQDDALTINTFDDVTINVAYADTTDNTSIALTADGVSCVNANNIAIDFTTLTTTPGDKEITVNYAGFSDTFTVTVVEKDSALKSLTVSTQPTTTSYTAGATNVSFAGLVITGVYQDDLHRDDDVIPYDQFATYGVQLLYNDTPITNYNSLTQIETIGANNVEVKALYLGKAAAFNLTVTNNIVSIALTTTSTKVAYMVDEDIDFSGLSINVTCNYGSYTLTGVVSGVSIYNGSVDVTSNLNSLTSSPSNSRAVTVKHGGQEASFNISVEDYVTDIVLSGPTEYTTFVNTTSGSKKTSFEGLVVTANYKSGASSDATLNATYTNNGIEQPETKTVTVSYAGYSGQITLIVVDELNTLSVSNIPTGIVKNGTVDLSGIIVNGTYSYAGEKLVNVLQADGKSFLYGIVRFELKDALDEYQVLKQTEMQQIAVVAGTRYLKLSYTYYDKIVSAEFTVTVQDRSGSMTGFELPSSLVSYNDTIQYAKANQGDPTSEAFESALFANDEEYLVGDDNPFKFVPRVTFVDLETSSISVLQSFKAVSTITLLGDEPTVLATDSSGYIRNHKINETIYVVETINENKYQFTADALGKKFKISVLPDPSEITYNPSDFSAVEWTVKVVDGYNITDPRELCLLEQPSAKFKAENHRYHWDSIKSELGLTGIRPTSIILHNNMVVTADSLPSSLTYTFDNSYPIYYKYGEDVYRPEDVPSELGGPLSRTFIYDKQEFDGEYGLFRYDMNDRENFAIHGNFFDIDLSKLPLVCPFEPQGVEMAQGYDLYYMPYMSKLSFIEVYGEDIRERDKQATGQCTSPTESDSEDEYFTFDNFAVMGNCSPKDLLVDTSTRMNAGEDNPVYGGGIIFVKTHYCHANITNINAHSCFISFFSRNYTVVNYTKCKSYDTYLNGVFAHSETDVHMYNCHMKRAGGPLMILCHSTDDLDSNPNDSEYDEIPRVVADDDCVFECYVTGQEQWFASNNAPISMVQVLNGALINSVGKTFQKERTTVINGVNVTKTYFNLIAVVIEEGSNPIGNSSTQGSFSYAGETMHKIDGDPYFNGSGFDGHGYVTVKGLLDTGYPLAGVGNSTIAIDAPQDPDHGIPVSMLINPFTGNPVSSGDGIYEEFQNNHDFVVLYYGGFGIFTGLWNA